MSDFDLPIQNSVVYDGSGGDGRNGSYVDAK